MYRPSPASDRPPGRLGAPRSVTTAVRLMYAGAALEILNVLLALTALHVTSAYTGGVILGGVVETVLWLWMAQANRAGRNWARITATVFFGLSCLGAISAVLLLSVSPSGLTGLQAGASLLTWLVGLAAIVMLWRRESSHFFAS